MKKIKVFILVILLTLTGCQSKGKSNDRRYYEGYRNIFPTFDSCISNARFTQKREISYGKSYSYDYLLHNKSINDAETEIKEYISILEEYGLSVDTDYELDDAIIWGVYTANERIGRFSVEETEEDVKISVHPFDKAEPIS